MCVSVCSTINSVIYIFPCHMTIIAIIQLKETSLFVLPEWPLSLIYEMLI